MKVIHLISGGDVGGAKTHVLSLLKGLNQTETVHLVCFTEGTFADEARQLQIPTTVMTGSNMLKECTRLVAMIRHGGYEVIHCHGARANLMGWLLKRRLDIPVVTTVHSDYRLDYLGRPFGKLTYGTINKIALRKMDYWIGVSDPMANLLISRGFDPQRMFAIYNGVDFSPRTPGMSRSEFLNSIGVQADENTTVFGIAARLNPVKDIATLLSAFSEAAKVTPNLRLLIAGEGEQEAALKKMAEESCPPGTVFFLGWIKDTDSFYHALDVNVLTSLSETFPYALTEGARWRCATIASNVGGVPYLIDDGINGLLFAPQDVNALTKHMILLAQNPALRQRLGDRLYEKASRDFSIDATVEKQKEIYRTIIRRAGRYERKRDGVVVCGAYGMGNSGDEALLGTIVAQLREIDPDVPIYVLTRDPLKAKTLLRIGAIKTFDFCGAAKRLKKTKLYISGGGTLMQDVTSTRSLLYYLFSLKMAKRLGNQVMLYGCGVGPISRPNNRKRAGEILEKYADVITLRDDYSLQTLHDLGVMRPEIHLTADPALLCTAREDNQATSYLLSVGIEENTRYAMFALRHWQGFEEKIGTFVAAAEYVYRAFGLTPVFFAMEKSSDLSAVTAVADRVKCPHLIASAAQEGSLTVSLIHKMSLMVSMRLHGLIFAASQGVPTVGIVYDPKVSGFLDYLDQDLYMDLNEVNPGALNDLIDSALSGAVAEKDSVQRLRGLAARNGELAKKLLES